MLSFLLCIGTPAARAAVDHRNEIIASLAQRSWCDVVDVPPVHAPQELLLFDCGDNASICRDGDWQLLRAPLVRRAPTNEERTALRQMHLQLQGTSVSRAEQILRSTLSKREEHAVWVAWSETHRCAIAFRDPLGRVPLYLYDIDGSYMLTNTRRALEPWTQHEPIASKEVLTSLLVQGTAPTNEHGLLRNLTRIAPGTTATIRPDHAPQRSPWWRWVDPTLQKITMEDAAAQYRALLRRSVDATLNESMLGVELSGGMDSTTVLAAARDVRPDVGIHAINFAGHDQDEDRVLARALCEEWGITFHPINPLEPLARSFPDPATPNTAAHTLQRLEALDRPVDVLSGHGGDNLFRVQRADIDRIRREMSPLQWLQLTRAHRRIHGQLPPLFLRQRLRNDWQQNPMAEYPLPWFSPELAERIQEFVHRRLLDANATSTVQSMCEHPRWSSILEMGDAGYHGARVQYHFPIFDLDLMRFVAQIPSIPWRYDKYLARVAWQDHLPASITERRKTVYRPQGQNTAKEHKTEHLVAAEHLEWTHIPALKQWMSTSESFPEWTFATAHAIIALLQWAGPESTSRLTIPTNVVR